MYRKETCCGPVLVGAHSLLIVQNTDFKPCALHCNAYTCTADGPESGIPTEPSPITDTYDIMARDLAIIKANNVNPKTTTISERNCTSSEDETTATNTEDEDKFASGSTDTSNCDASLLTEMFNSFHRLNQKQTPQLTTQNKCVFESQRWDDVATTKDVLRDVVVGGSKTEEGSVMEVVRPFLREETSAVTAVVPLTNATAVNKLDSLGALDLSTENSRRCMATAH